MDMRVDMDDLLLCSSESSPKRFKHDPEQFRRADDSSMAAAALQGNPSVWIRGLCQDFDEFNISFLATEVKNPFQQNESEAILGTVNQTRDSSISDTRKWELESIRILKGHSASSTKIENMVQFEIETIAAVEKYFADQMGYNSQNNQIIPHSVLHRMMSISDATFEMLLNQFSCRASTENIFLLTIHAMNQFWNDKVETDYLPKFISIIKNCIMPRLPEAFYRFDPIFDRLVEVNEDLVIDNLLIPLLIQKDWSSPTWLMRINWRLFLTKAIESLSKQCIHLSPNIMDLLHRLLNEEQRVYGKNVLKTEQQFLEPSTEEDSFQGVQLCETHPNKFYFLIRNEINQLSDEFAVVAYARTLDLRWPQMYNRSIYRELILDLVQMRLTKLQGSRGIQTNVHVHGTPSSAHLAAEMSSVRIETLGRPNQVTSIQHFVSNEDQIGMEY